MPSFDSLTQLIVLNASPLLLNSRFSEPELASNTATRPCPSSATYSSFVASSTATPNGRSTPPMLDTYLPVLSNFSTAVAPAGAAAGAAPRPAAAGAPPWAAAPCAAGAGPRPRAGASDVGQRPPPTYTLPALSTAMPDGSYGQSKPFMSFGSQCASSIPAASNSRICGAAKQHELAHGSSAGPFSLVCSESTPRCTTQM